MSDAGTVWTVFAIGAAGLAILMWVLAGSSLRRWWQLTAHCPRGEHGWVWSGEMQSTASRRYCRWCQMDDPLFRDRERKSDGSKVTRAWTVTDTRMVAVHGTWGDAVDYWVED